MHKSTTAKQILYKTSHAEQHWAKPLYTSAQSDQNHTNKPKSKQNPWCKSAERNQIRYKTTQTNQNLSNQQSIKLATNQPALTNQPTNQPTNQLTNRAEGVSYLLTCVGHQIQFSNVSSSSSKLNLGISSWHNRIHWYFIPNYSVRKRIGSFSWNFIYFTIIWKKTRNT